MRSVKHHTLVHSLAQDAQDLSIEFFDKDTFEKEGNINSDAYFQLKMYKEDVEPTQYLISPRDISNPKNILFSPSDFFKENKQEGNGCFYHQTHNDCEVQNSINTQEQEDFEELNIHNDEDLIVTDDFSQNNESEISKKGN